MMSHDPIMTVPEVAERLRISADLVRDLILRGELAAAKVGGPRGTRGGRYLIPKSAVTRWLDDNVTLEKKEGAAS